MAAVVGTSIVGFQQLGTLAVTANRFVNLFPLTGNAFLRSERIGTLLITYNDAGSNQAVSKAVKIYGNGLALGNDPSLPGVILQVWAQWYVAGFGWQCITP
jgi:hypothetical protein